MKRTALVSVLVALLCLGHAGCSGDDDGDNGSDGGTGGSDAGTGGSDAGTASSEFEKVTISPQGGTHEFSAGFKVVVPAGAVEQDTEIEMRLVGSDELRPVYEAHGLSVDILLAAVEGKPDGLTFKVPIKVTMSADVEPVDFPVVYAMDLITKERSRVLTTVMTDPDKDLVELTMHHFSPPQATEGQKENERAKKFCEEDPCKCQRVSSTTNDEDVLCGGGDTTCQVLKHTLTVDYLDCGSVHEEEHQSVSDKCTPKMTLEPAASKVCPKKDTQIKATVNFGCPSARMEGQTVEFSAGAPASVSPASGVTNASGEATTTLTAGPEEGKAEVTATSTVKYYTLFKLISFEGQVLSEKKNERTANLSQKATVDVEPGRWKGTLTYNARMNYGCVDDKADYNGSFNLEVDCEESWVTGTATMNQSVSVSATCADFNVASTNAPASLSLMADGEADDYLHVEFVLDLQYPPFYTYDMCNPDDCSGPQGHLYMLNIGYTQLDKNAVPLKAGTYNGSWSWEPTEPWNGTYTITLEEVE